jgi:hypothetical protein
MTQTAAQPTQSAELESEAEMWARAEEALRLAERAWESYDVNAIASGFSEDCIVRYAEPSDNPRARSACQVSRRPIPASQKLHRQKAVVGGGAGPNHEFIRRRLD